MTTHYFCKTENGVYAPKFKHPNLDSAKLEADRLCSVYGSKVEILMCVGTVEWKEVPVTQKVRVTELLPTSELPF